MAAKTVTYKGKLTMLGNSRSDRGGSVYSVIEMGNETIDDVLCLDKLDNYLHRAFNHSGEVELEILPKPTQGEVIKMHFGTIFNLKVLAVLVVLSVFSWIWAGPLAILFMLFFLLLIGAGLFASLSETINRPRYAIVTGILIDEKRYSN